MALHSVPEYTSRLSFELALNRAVERVKHAHRGIDDAVADLAEACRALDALTDDPIHQGHRSGVS